MMFFSQFPTVLTHKQVYSAGLIAAKVSQENEAKKVVVVVGGVWSIWVHSRSSKFCVSGPHQTCNVCGKRHGLAGCYSDHTLVTS